MTPPAPDDAVPDASGPETSDRAPDRATVLDLLAGFGGRAPRQADDEIGSLELTWLIAQFERQYSVIVELDDAELSRVRTVEQAADALRGVLGLPPLVPSDAAGVPAERA